MEQLTLSIIKPDAMRRGLAETINNKITEAGLRIVCQKQLQLSKAQAERFYAVHKERPFFNELVEIMITEPIIAQVLSAENAVTRYRELMGATDPAKALDGTLRKEFALNIGENSVHGSDSNKNAVREVSFFFAAIELYK